MEIKAVRTEGLGDSTYVLAHEGIAVVVDPQRDIDRFEALLDEMGVHLRFVLETHLHNDYISGGRDLATRAGAELVLPAGAAPVFRHRPAFHHEDLDGGSLVVRPVHTPGHTPEHTSYLVLVDGLPLAVFTGGSLLVGSAGRSDLLGPERAETLARLQYRSVNRLAELPDAVALYPTHGAGSFCTATGAGQHTSTIGAEKATNPVLAYPDEEAFVSGQLSALVPYPSYYSQMGPANIAGRDAVSVFEAPTITEASFDGLDSDVIVVDARPKADVAKGHLPESWSIELRRDFGVWVGWVLPYDAPLALVLDPGQDVEEAFRQLARIGFDDLRGVITDLPNWERPLVSRRLVGIDGFADAVGRGAQVLDVRAPNEWASGTIHGSTLAYVPDVVAGIPENLDKSRPVWIVCETGYRASIAASVLETEGYEPVVLAGGGVTEVLRELSNNGATRWRGAPLTTG